MIELNFTRYVSSGQTLQPATPNRRPQHKNYIRAQKVSTSALTR
jgi:hypothetical protein